MNPDETSFDINFDKLERELNDAVMKEKRYWTENDAKLRAVNQKVGSYEEFKEIVAASHLKPLDRGESVRDIDSKRQPWNTIAGKSTPSLGLEEITTKPNSSEQKIPFEKKPTTKPKSVQEFMRYWRLQLTAADKFRYLNWVGLHQLNTLFQPDLGFGLLGDFIACYHEVVNLPIDGEQIVPSQTDVDEQSSHIINFILNSLYMLARTNRFFSGASILSLNERKLCKELFLCMESKVSDETREMFVQLVSDYNVTVSE